MHDLNKTATTWKQQQWTRFSYVRRPTIVQCSPNNTNWAATGRNMGIGILPEDTLTWIESPTFWIKSLSCSLTIMIYKYIETDVGLLYKVTLDCVAIMWTVIIHLTINILHLYEFGTGCKTVNKQTIWAFQPFMKLS